LIEDGVVIRLHPDADPLVAVSRHRAVVLPGLTKTINVSTRPFSSGPRSSRRKVKV
jgi:hypothetical protein